VTARARALPRLNAPRACALLAFAVTLLVHGALIPEQGLTDDDDFYAPAGIRAASWLGDVVTKPGTAFSRSSVDAAFQINHEHPPLAKMVFGTTHALFHEGLGLFASLDAARLGTALFAALLSALLVLLLWGPLGAIPALAAPLLLLSLPRFFFHSEVATLDVPVACGVLAVAAAFFWVEAGARRSAWAPVLVGVVFGLALLIKLNAPFAAIPCALWALAGRWRGVSIGEDGISLPPIPRSLLWMAVLGPILFVALWPWLWFETAERLGGYLAFHLRHYPILLFYGGEIWEKPFAPWHAVLTLGFGVLPAPVLLLGALGVGRALAALVRLVRLADDEGLVPDVGDGDKLRALLLLQAAFSMAIVANPAVPRYGGEKLFMPFFPLFCALAADGLALVVAAVRALWPRLPVALPAAAVVVLACAPGFFGTMKHQGGYALSYYGELVGGLRGAVARGHERTYYDVADKGLARWLDENARGLRVRFEPNHKEYARTYRWLLRDDVIERVALVDASADGRRAADIVVLTHERRWATYPALLDELTSTRTAVYEKSIDGVPLYTVFRRR
jgi:hypothetical protein